MLTGVTAVVVFWLSFVLGSDLDRGDRRRNRLRLTDNNTFRIIQFADLHFGECPDTDWGPEQDKKTKTVLADLLAFESPQLAILTGDQITGLNIDDNATVVWDSIIEVIDQTETPHTAILGNHDAEPYSGNGGMDEPGAKTNRTQLMEHDSSLPWSLSDTSPVYLQPAASTYVVDVFPAKSYSQLSSDVEEPVLQLFHMDSGGGGMPEEISSAQVEWFNAVILERRQRYTHPVPALLFIHIPFNEFSLAWNSPNGQCWGDKLDGVSSVENDGGLFAALSNTVEVQGVFVGHNHCNDFCCDFSSKKLCFGRHSSYGGYNCDDYMQGARVVDVEVSNKSTDISTHVRLLNGDVIHEGAVSKYSPKTHFI